MIKYVIFNCFSYDTFEMLRENLDTVLKELLEFKTNEHVVSVYPGPHLDLEDNFLKNFKHSHKKKPLNEELNHPPYDTYIDIVDKINKDLFNKTRHTYVISNAEEKSEIVNRIRRYLDKKSVKLEKPETNMNSRINLHLAKYNKNLLENAHKSFNVYSNKIRKKIPSQEQIKRYYNRKLQKYQNIHKNKRMIRESTVIKELIPDHLKNSHDPANGDAALKARFLFKSCMNYETLHRRAHKPLLDLLDLLGGWPILQPGWNSSDFDWLELMAKLRLYNNDILISEWVGPDIKNSDEFVIQFDQTSLGTSNNS